MQADDPRRSIKLSQLVQDLEEWKTQPVPDIDISGVSMDSRRISPGDLFVAVSGGVTDGHRFIPDALRRGASAIVGDLPYSGLDVPYLLVSDSRLALAQLAAAYYGNPARRLVMIGVTGTDGKTTTSNLIFSILRAAGLQAGMVSTVNALIGDQALDTGFHVTTPDAPDVQAYLAQMVESGLSHVVLEATSHGLAQQRVAACEFDMAVVTNITHEHLDYHGSYKAYQAAKGRLFASLASTKSKASSPPRAAVLNRDDLSFEYLAGITKAPILSYGLDLNANIRPLEVETQRTGLRMRVVGKKLDGQDFTLPVTCQLVGGYNVSNILAAVALTCGVMALDPGSVQEGVSRMQAVPGRMESIEMGQDFTAFVDFAHTPNALKCTLMAARQLTTGRVIVVFGSAGLRDRAKRLLMAEVSAELADLSILTAEDPRTESLSAILAEMADGARSRGGVEGQNFWRIPDRRAALRFAVELARPEDLVIACGKGHEQSMCFGEVEYPWDDRVALRAALAERLGLPGPPMPALPNLER